MYSYLGVNWEVFSFCVVLVLPTGLGHCKMCVSFCSVAEAQAQRFPVLHPTMQQHHPVGNNVSPHLQATRQELESSVWPEHLWVVLQSSAILQSPKQVRHNKYISCITTPHNQFLCCGEDWATLTLHKQSGTHFSQSTFLIFLISARFIFQERGKRGPDSGVWRGAWFCRHGFGNLYYFFLEFFPAAVHALRRVWMAMMLRLEASRLRKAVRSPNIPFCPNNSENATTGSH